jgi:hypothetical protein
VTAKVLFNNQNAPTPTGYVPKTGLGYMEAVVGAAPNCALAWGQAGSPHGHLIDEKCESVFALLHGHVVRLDCGCGGGGGGGGGHAA